MRRRRRFPRMDRRSTKLRRLAEMMLRVRRGLELLPRRASPSCRASHLVLSPAVLSRLLLLGPERQMLPLSTTPACSSLTGDSHLRLSDVSEVRSCENDDLVFP